MTHLLRQTLDGSLTLSHKDHSQCFHSESGALFEAQKLYLESSKLLDCLRSHPSKESIKILDLGLGLGYNALASLDAWTKIEGKKASVKLISLELDCELFFDLLSTTASWQANWSCEWKTYLKVLKEKTKTVFEAEYKAPCGAKFIWQVYLGDAIETLKNLSESSFLFIWQDAFSPKLSPRLWSESWFSLVHQKSHKEAKLLTYSVARLVKDNLTKALWQYEKIKAPGQKNHWLLARPQALES